MAITATLVYSSPTRMAYLVVATAGSAETVTIPGATLLADAPNGPLKQVLNVAAAGYGKIAAGTTITQALARSLLLGDSAITNIGGSAQTGGFPKPIITRVEQRSGTGTIVADADTDPGAPTQPELNITATAAGAASAMVWLEIPGAIG